MTVIDLRKRLAARKKDKFRLKDKVFLDLINECADLGEPDIDLIDKILRNVDRGRVSNTDVFAMYLYRKKAGQ